MSYNAKANKKYNNKCAFFSMKYSQHEQKESDRLKQYLLENNLTFNSYVKALIYEDLNRKGIKYPGDQDL